MKLIYESSGEEVKKGDILTSFRGENYIAHYWREPSHGVGKICVKKTPNDIGQEFYVTVFGLKWIEEESSESKLDITKMLTISTTHITEEMDKRLSRNGETDELGVCCYEYEYGHIIYCHSDMEDLLERKELINPELFTLMEYAQLHDCQWLRLDCDAEIVPALPWYDW